MSKFKQVIHGYTVELETDLDEDPPTQCDIEKNGAYASLAALTQQGYLLTSRDLERPVNQLTIDRIEEWALKNGY